MSTATPAWRVTENTIAALLSREDLAGHWVLEKKITVHPGEAALWMSKGQVVRVVTEGQTVVSGVMNWFKRLFETGDDLVLMMVDLNEILLHFRLGVDKESIFVGDSDFYGQLLGSYGSRTGEESPKPEAGEPAQPEGEGTLALEFPPEPETDKEKEKFAAGMLEKYVESLEKELSARSAITTSDGKNVVFDARLTVRIIPEHTVEMFKLFRGRLYLEKQDLIPLVRSELEALVFGPAVKKFTARQLSRDLNTLGKLNKAAKSRLTSFLPGLGLEMVRLAVNPALSVAEREDVLEREKESLQKQAKKQHQNDLVEIRREYEKLRLREELALQLDQAKQEQDQEKQQIIRAALVHDKNQELSGAKIDDEIRRMKDAARLERMAKEKELELSGASRQWELDKQRLNHQAQVEMDQMRALAQEHRKNKEQKIQHKMQQMDARDRRAVEERRHVEKLLELGAEQGAVDADVLKEAIRQETVRKALDQGDFMGQVFGEAEARRHSKEAFVEGVASQPQVEFAGQGPVYVRTGQDGPSPAGNGSAALPSPAPVQPALPPGQGQASEDILSVCPQCGQGVPEDSIFCGYCGNRLKTD